MSREGEPSRSARKRDDDALQTLGERLVGLSAEALARIPLPEDLADAIREARRIHERGGHRRQLQYIGKLMRRVDTAPILAAIAALDARHHDESDAFHRAEQWRDRLLREPGAVKVLCEECPKADAQRLTQLVHEAAAEHAAGKPPRHARELFRYLRDEVL
jgi:ribosome-associated protein